MNLHDALAPRACGCMHSCHELVLRFEGDRDDTGVSLLQVLDLKPGLEAGSDECNLSVGAHRGVGGLAVVREV